MSEENKDQQEESMFLNAVNKNITDNFKILTDNLPKTETVDKPDTVEDFADHLNTCDNSDGNCEVHKSISKTANKSYLKGFLLGAKFGKQKRN